MNEKVLEIFQKSQNHTKTELELVEKAYLRVWADISQKYNADLFKFREDRTVNYEINVTELLAKDKINMGPRAKEALRLKLERDGIVYNSMQGRWYIYRCEVEDQLKKHKALEPGLK